FLEALQECNLGGGIATEQSTPAGIASDIGIDFLEAFLAGLPVGPIFRDLRRRHLPYGLLYGTYCPLDVRALVAPGAAAPGAPARAVCPGASGTVDLGRGVVAAPLPEAPYRSLASYDRAHRALFAGRDADVSRFAQVLDEPATRVLVLQGESGVGKSSF